VEAYADATAEIILAGLRADQEKGWTPEIRARYESAVNDGGLIGECSVDALVGALTAGFEKAYDAKPPESSADFRELVLPSDSPARPGDYISASVAALGFATVNQRLQRALLSPAPRVHYDTLERETRIAQVVYTLDAARELRRVLQESYRSDSEIFELPPLRRKAAAMSLFRKIVTNALSGTQIQCAPLSMKQYAATL
jgi:hypothetical protein